MSLPLISDPAIASLWQDNPCAVLFELAKRMPGQDLDLKLGDLTLRVVQSAASARHILRDNVDTYHKHFGSLVYFFGKSRLTTDGAEWQRLRQLTQPDITRVRPEAVLDSTLNFYGDALDDMLEEQADAGMTIADTHLDRAAARTISELVLGIPFESFGPDILQDFIAIRRQSVLISWNVSGTGPKSDLLVWAEAEAARDRLQAAIDALLNQHRQNAGQSGPIDAMLREMESEKFDLVGEISTMMFAGFDTTASAVGWAMFLLANDQSLQDRLRAHVQQVCDGTGVTQAQVSALPQLEAFVAEVLRIFPPIPFLGRVSRQPDMLGGKPFPANSIALISIIGLHHDATRFKSPFRVDLDRFPGGATPKHLIGQYIPFGDGRRICGGARIANAELMAALALILQRVRVTFADKRPLALDWAASMRRSGGQRFHVEALS